MLGKGTDIKKDRTIAPLGGKLTSTSLPCFEGRNSPTLDYQTTVQKRIIANNFTFSKSPMLNVKHMVFPGKDLNHKK